MQSSLDDDGLSKKRAGANSQDGEVRSMAAVHDDGGHLHIPRPL